LLPTLIVLVVLALVEVLSRQRLLFASLASSAFLIYLDPFHGMNTVRALVGALLLAALTGLLTFWIFGHSYAATGSAMIVTIVLMVLLDMVHPPAVGTALSFAFQTGAESTLVLFMLALSITAVLVILERVTLWLLARLSPA
jgi:CBS-domain-containing membrane protein